MTKTKTKKKVPKKRKTWAMNPVTRIVEDKTKFNRARVKQAERKNND